MVLQVARSMRRLLLTCLLVIAAQAAFATAPTIQDNVVSSTITNGSGVITMSSADVGDYWLLVVSFSTNTAPTTPTGWTSLTNSEDGGASTPGRQVIYYRQVQMGDPATITISAGSTINIAVICITIDGATGVPTASTPATGTSAAPDPGSVAPGGSEDRIFLATAHSGTSTGSYSASPSGYTFVNEVEKTATSTIYTHSAAAYKNGTSSDDPGAFTFDGSCDWVATTVQFPGTAAGGSSPLLLITQQE
jgi:hypothetical protein